MQTQKVLGIDLETIVKNDDRSCPLVDAEIISYIDCYEIRLVADGYIKTKCLPEQIKHKKNFREVCLNCKYNKENY